MTQEVIPPSRPERVTMIKNLIPRLPERYHIKIGGKGAVRKAEGGKEYQIPEKYDHFVITGMERDASGNFARDAAINNDLGPKPKEIPIRLLYDDPSLNFVSRLAAYKGKALWCAGDGEKASRIDPQDPKKRVEVACPCERSRPEYEGADKCKFSGVLTAVIDTPSVRGVNGVAKFRTTSYNSVVDIYGSLLRLQDLTYGTMAGVPLKLVLHAKHVADPQGKPQTIYTVSIDTRDMGAEQLQSEVERIVKIRATGRVRMEQIEADARKALELPAPETGRVLPGDPDDIQAEFHPDEETLALAAADKAKAENRDMSSIRLAKAPDGTTHDKETGEVIEQVNPHGFPESELPGTPNQAELKAVVAVSHIVHAEKPDHKMEKWLDGKKYVVKNIDQFLKAVAAARTVEELTEIGNQNEILQRQHTEVTGPALTKRWKELTNA